MTSIAKLSVALAFAAAAAAGAGCAAPDQTPTSAESGAHEYRTGSNIPVRAHPMTDEERARAAADAEALRRSGVGMKPGN